MLSDYHVHLEHGPLDPGWLGEFVRSALDKGVTDLGISEHGDRFAQYEPVMGHLAYGPGALPEMAEWLSQRFEDDLDEYSTLISKAREGFGVKVKFGLEADYIPGKEEVIRKVLASYPFDYVIGSLHFLGYWDFDYSPEIGWQDRDVDAVWEDYFGTVLSLVESGLFDILGHADVVKVFGHKSSKPLGDHYERLSMALAASGMCAEVNTAGWRKPIGEIYPAPDLLRTMYSAGVPIVLNSDAHFPEHVGYRFMEAKDYIRACGYSKLAVYENRRFDLRPICP